MNLNHRTPCLGAVTRSVLVVGAALALVASASAATVPGVRSPSGSIRCVVSHATLFCTIANAVYASRLQDNCLNPPGGARGSGVDWHGWTLSARGRGQVSCTGGALWFGTPRYSRLPFGQTWRLRPFTCVSAVGGLRCRNRAGHGLFLSRVAWRAW